MFEVDIFRGFYQRRAKVHLFFVSNANLDTGSQISLWEPYRS